MKMWTFYCGGKWIEVILSEKELLIVFTFRKYVFYIDQWPE